MPRFLSSRTNQKMICDYQVSKGVSNWITHGTVLKRSIRSCHHNGKASRNHTVFNDGHSIAICWRSWVPRLHDFQLTDYVLFLSALPEPSWEVSTAHTSDWSSKGTRGTPAWAAAAALALDLSRITKLIFSVSRCSRNVAIETITPHESLQREIHRCNCISRTI